MCNLMDMFEYIIIGSSHRIFKCDHFEARYNVTWCQKFMTPNWLYLSMIHRKYNQHITHIHITIPNFTKDNFKGRKKSAEYWPISSKTSTSTERKKSILRGFFVKFKISSSSRLWGVKISWKFYVRVFH